jgi:hypothetical protein
MILIGEPLVNYVKSLKRGRNLEMNYYLEIKFKLSIH